MTFARRMALTLGAFLGLATLSWAQGMGMGMRPPEMPGQFNPVVGSGGEYEITSKGQTMDWTYAVVGKETVNGQDGYWLEMRGESPRGKVVMKQLMGVRGGEGASGAHDYAGSWAPAHGDADGQDGEDGCSQPPAGCRIRARSG